VRWGDDLRSYQGKHLVGGGAAETHRAFVAAFERARSPRGKMLAINQLVHAFRWELVSDPGRSAARAHRRQEHDGAADLPRSPRAWRVQYAGPARSEVRGRPKTARLAPASAHRPPPPRPRRVERPAGSWRWATGI